MGKYGLLPDAVLKISVNLWFLFTLVWFHLWALLFYYFTDTKRHTNREQERTGKSNQRMAGAEVITLNFIIIDIPADLY